jgi:hypothetical protein
LSRRAVKTTHHPLNQPINQRNSGAYIGGVHLFPFRTEKLSPPEPMVLQ